MPEVWCSPSMFWVMTALILPCSTSLASARCPALGVALSMALWVANLRRQVSRRASAEARNASNGIGLYLVQMPPGERKSGMPDSVEMPAPVKATMLPASAIIRLRSSMVSDPLGLTPWRQPSLLLDIDIKLYSCAADLRQWHACGVRPRGSD